MKRYFVALPLLISLLSSTATAKSLISEQKAYDQEFNPFKLAGQSRSAELLAQSKINVLEKTFLELSQLKAVIEALREQKILQERELKALQKELTRSTGKRQTITQDLIETVVRIEAYNQHESTRGSGTVISPDGLILTNAHVIASDQGEIYPFLEVCLTKNPKNPPKSDCYDAEIIDYVFDYEYVNSADIALVKVKNAPQLTYFNIIENSTTFDLSNITEPLTALGYPSQAGDTLTVLQGNMAGFSGGFEYDNEQYVGYVKTDIVLDKGISGGAVVDLSHQFVGIPSASTEHYGFVIPMEDILDFMREVAADKQIVLTENTVSLP